jgi:hypothetical protein
MRVVPCRHFQGIHKGSSQTEAATCITHCHGLLLLRMRGFAATATAPISPASAPAPATPTATIPACRNTHRNQRFRRNQGDLR